MVELMSTKERVNYNLEEARFLPFVVLPHCKHLCLRIFPVSIKKHKGNLQGIRRCYMSLRKENVPKLFIVQRTCATIQVYDSPITDGDAASQ